MKKLHSFHWIVLFLTYLFSPATSIAQGSCATAVNLTPGIQQCANTMAGGDVFDDNICLGTYAGGDDYLYVYTVPLAEDGFVMQLNLSSNSTRTGIAISEGCPESAGGICFGSATSPAANESLISLPLSAGQTYYIHISSLPAPQNFSFCLNTIIGPAGCTNPLAINYDPSSLINDGTCSFPPAASTCGTFSSAPLDSIDNTLGPVVDVINIALGPMEVLTDLDVVLEIEHSSLADLDIQLESPAGTVVRLMLDECSSFSDLSVRFDDNSSNFICNSPTVGFYHPPDGNLSDFNNELVDGNWTLQIIDDSGGDHGKLLNWCLLPKTTTVSCLAVTNLSASNVNFNSAELSWDDPNVPSPANWDIEIGEQGFTPSGFATHQVSTNIGASITGLIPETTYDFYVRSNCTNDSTSFWVGPASFTSFISNPSICGMGLPVADNSCDASNEFLIKVDNAPADQLGINVILEELRLIVAHPWDNDLDISLISPSGVSVELSTDNGSGDDNYGDPSDTSCGSYTAFSSDECLSVSILDGVAPFIGSFLPEGNLNDFHDGTNPNGIWKLVVCDDANNDAGVLEFVELVFSPTACPAPSDLSVTQINASSLDLDWTLGGFCMQTIIEYGPSGFLPGTTQVAGAGNVVTVACPVAFPFNLSGLSELTDYDVYVREECSPGIFSKNTCVATARTDCSTGALSLVENFDAQPTCATSCGSTCSITGTWQNDSNDDFDWLIDNFGTTSSNTGPTDDISGGGNYIYMEGSGSTCQNGNKAILRSNCIAVEASSGNCHLSFNYHMFGVNINQLALEITTNGGNSWQLLWQESGNQMNEWRKTFIDLSTYHGLNVQFRFIAFGGNGFAGDIALDEIRFYGSLDLGPSVNVFYTDSDLDGFGNPQDSIFSCLAMAPTGYVANNLDCDDGNNMVHPNATEIPCNELDDNCNGAIDDLLVPEPLVTDTAICQTQSVRLSSPTIPIGTLYWFDQAEGGEAIGVGNSFETPSLNNSKTYYLQDSSSINKGLKITEIDLGSIDAIEIQSIGTSGDYAGWVVALSNSYTNINLVNPSLWFLGTMTENELDYKTDSPLDNYWGNNILWGAGTFPTVAGWAMILDDQGKVVDAVFWGWQETDIQNFTALINGHIVTGDMLAWAGTGIDVSTNCDVGNSIQLSTPVEQNQASDYFNCTTSTMGTENADLGVLISCSSNRVPVYVEVLPQPEISTSDMPFICQGESFDLTTVNVVDLNNTGGTYSFHSGSPATSSNLLASPIVHPSSDTSFVILSTSSGACTDETIVYVSLNEIPNVQITPSGSATICNNESIELVASNASGGLAPFSYEWNTGDTGPNLTITASATSPASADYIVTITDANACTNTEHFTLNTPGSITAISILSIQDVSTCGGSDGSITLSPVDGISPYDYQWVGPVSGAANQVSGIFNMTGLAQGSYRVTISDNTNLSCQIIVPLLIVNGPDAVVSLTNATDVSCYGGNDGAIDIFTSAINPSFLWNNGHTTEDISGLEAGNYSVTVSAGICANVLSDIEIQSPDSISSQINSLQAIDCFGAATGAIDLQVNGGRTPYQFQWNHGATTEDLSGLLAGEYWATITDANNCSVVTPISSLEESNQIELSIEQIQEVACAGLPGGSIDVSVTGGVEPYNYNWSNGANTQDLNNVLAGTYILTLTDALSCEIISEPITITQVDALNININSINSPICQEVQNGSIDLQISGGTMPYTFEWNNGFSTEDIYGVDEGSYIVSITDANQCMTVSSPIALSYATTLDFVLDDLQDASCEGISDGSIEVTIQGGLLPYTYLWSNGESTEDILDLEKGAYQLSLSDANGCLLETSTFLIQAPQALDLTIDAINKISCYGADDGAIDISVTGGTAPYSYYWNHGLTEEDVSQLSPGDYFCEITDVNGCQLLTDIFQIRHPDSLRLELIAIENSSCNGIADGSIDILVIGGTAPYSFDWDNGETTEDLSGIPSGNYKLNVVDANGCIANSPLFTVEEPEAIQITVDRVDNLGCTGEESGAIEVSVAGGTMPYHYLWNNGETTEDIYDISAGSYTLTVTDANACKSLVSSILVSQLNNGLIVNTIYEKDISCEGDNDGAFGVLVQGGTGPYQYNWSNGIEYDIHAASDTITGLDGGSYSVTITDNNGCVGVSPITSIEEPSELSFFVTNVDHVACFGDSTGRIDLFISGGQSPYTVVWNNNMIGASISDLPAGQYSFTIIDANNCVKSSLQALQINQPSNPIALFNVETEDVLCFGDENGAINVTPFGGIAPYFFEWNDGSTTEDLEGLNGGMYQLSITDLNNCEFVSPVFNISEPSQALNLDNDSIYVVTNACHGDQLGSIEVYPTGGTPPYEYLWSNNAATPSIQNLSAGIYRVSIIDQHNCMIVSPWLSITTPTALQLDTITTIASFNQADGTATVLASGGTDPYSYQWDAQAGGQTDASAIGLSAGMYSVTVTDANGCSASIGAIVGSGSQPVSTTQLESLEKFQLFPNPTTGVAYLELQFNRVVDIDLQLFSVLGEKLQQSRFENVQQLHQHFDLSEHGAGIYLVKLSINQQEYLVRRLIVLEQ